MLTEKSFDTTDGTLNYVEGPAGGVPLVLLHGLATRWQVFLPIIPLLMPRYHIFALDLRGHGKSSRNKAGYRHSDDVADVVSFLQSRVKEPSILLGWSLGANISLTIAATDPHLVHALILADPPLSALTDDPTSQATFHSFIAILRDIALMDKSEGEKHAAFAALTPALNEGLVRFRFRHLSQCDPANFTSILERKRYEGYRLEDLLPKISCPTLIVQGNPALGAALDNATLERSKELLVDCAHVYLPDIGHGVHDTQPAEFAKLVSYFLESF